MGRPKKFDPDQATRDAKQAALTAYESVLNNIKQGIDKDATGSDRVNEIKAVMVGTASLKDLIKEVAELDRMIEEQDFAKKEGESDWDSTAENFID